MASKAKKTTRPAKSNVAKTSTLNESLAFDWKIVALIGLVLVALLGYLYVRFSKAATTPAVISRSWTYESFQLIGGYTLRDTYPGTYPVKAAYGQGGGAKIDTPIIDAGTYCWEPANMGYGGGSATITFSVYNKTSTGRTLVGQAKTTTTANNCVTVPAATAGVVDREVEFIGDANGAAVVARMTFSKTGDSGLIGAVTIGPKLWPADQVWVKPASNAGALVYQNGASNLLAQPDASGKPFLSANINSFIDGTAQYCANVTASAGSTYDFLVGWGDNYGVVKNNLPLASGAQSVCQNVNQTEAPLMKTGLDPGYRYVTFILKAPVGGSASLKTIEVKDVTAPVANPAAKTKQ